MWADQNIDQCLYLATRNNELLTKMNLTGQEHKTNYEQFTSKMLSLLHGVKWDSKKPQWMNKVEIKYTPNTRKPRVQLKVTMYYDEKTHLSSLLRAVGTAATDSGSGNVFNWGNYSDPTSTRSYLYFKMKHVLTRRSETHTVTFAQVILLFLFSLPHSAN